MTTALGTEGIFYTRYPNGWGRTAVEAEVDERNAEEWALLFGSGQTTRGFECRGDALQWWEEHKHLYSGMNTVKLVRITMRVSQEGRLYGCGANDSLSREPERSSGDSA